MDSPLASSGRDLDASKRSRDAPTPKKRTLGLAPGIFFSSFLMLLWCSSCSFLCSRCCRSESSAQQVF